MEEIEKILFERTVEISNNIARNDYSNLMGRGLLDRLSKKEIFEELNGYGGTLSIIDKENYYGRFSCYKCPNNKYETELDLVVDDRVSDLTLICEFTVENDVIIDELIEDIHVL